VVVGADDRNLRPELAALADSLGVSENLVFTGPVSDPRPPVCLMDVFILPSRLEGYGLVLLEALSYRRAVVATRVGGIPDIISGGEYGVLVPPESPAEMGEAITTLLLDPERRSRLGEAGFRRVWEEFGESKLEQLRDIYLELYQKRTEKAVRA
jgi:glycosyltransferase involved in cell wall biosynthesis